jgi:branched-subunit amino acid aminotransferase/4-amino-4-deoxychorismate lyase
VRGLEVSWCNADPAFVVGTQKAIGVNPPNEALLFVICSPVGPYFPTGFKPVSLMATTEYIRAAPGGTGGYKLGANYAPGVVPQKEAAKLGYSQNLWLQGPEHYLTEVRKANRDASVAEISVGWDYEFVRYPSQRGRCRRTRHSSSG